ncbi:GNAT family N-acetyltransferase [Patescibacteria group bacterium]|nr:GNAT family N-acetyltransferase [Patescibacteria group bacterium]MBU1916291.1 GNAT family N-acetyltransferase [Patescibacteria group bacterium]
MTIRLAEPADVVQLLQLYRQLSTRYIWNPSAVIAALHHPTTNIYVYVDDLGTILGTATLSTRAVPCYGLVGYVDDVVVDRAVQRQGIARQLMVHLHEQARQLDCRCLELTSHDQRSAAIKLYEQLGYERRETNAYRLLLGN